MTTEILHVYIALVGLGLALVGPPLRKDFFDGADIDEGDGEFDRVVTIAELFVNPLVHIAVLGDTFGDRNRPALYRYCTVALETSPILLRHLARNRASYSNTLHRLLESPPESIKTSHNKRDSRWK